MTSFASELRPGLRCTAFEGSTRIASGRLEEVARQTKDVLDRAPSASVLIFDDATGELVEVDFRGTAAEVSKRLANRLPAGGDGVPRSPAEAHRRGPGRPRLGVVAREVTLLPRHWSWLSGQPGGASAALRRLVDAARRDRAGADGRRRSQEAAYRFMSAMAGNRRGFEEACRALFAADRSRFEANVETWPVDVRDHARALADGAFAAESATPECPRHHSGEPR